MIKSVFKLQFLASLFVFSVALSAQAQTSALGFEQSELSDNSNPGSMNLKELASEFKADRNQDRKVFQEARQADLAKLKSGEITRQQFKESRQIARQEFKKERREDRQKFKQERRAERQNRLQQRRGQK